MLIFWRAIGVSSKDLRPSLIGEQPFIYESPHKHLYLLRPLPFRYDHPLCLCRICPSCERLIGGGNRKLSIFRMLPFTSVFTEFIFRMGKGHDSVYDDFGKSWPHLHHLLLQGVMPNSAEPLALVTSLQPALISFLREKVNHHTANHGVESNFYSTEVL
ncbi:hypothetical protein PIB30_068427 [Stylosanthes scabra]|uniref:Uncharacterized protein n=1 Tax=Stylosanthes scabra TaxID=79078 RepID=A0ABU6VNT9_9FABA|nr:hypothetical protein [Stylosanthes scabra]